MSFLKTIHNYRKVNAIGNVNVTSTSKPGPFSFHQFVGHTSNEEIEPGFSKKLKGNKKIHTIIPLKAVLPHR